MRRLILATFLSLFLFANSYCYNLHISDYPDDDGTRLVIKWDKLPPPELAAVNPEIYVLERAVDSPDDFIAIGTVLGLDPALGTTDEALEEGRSYFYRLTYSDSNVVWISDITGPSAPDENWYNTKRTNVLIGILVTGLVVGLYIMWGKKGKSYYLRPIAGLTAMDEAIGRATEMGKPILYSSGRGKMERPASIASMNILGSVCEKVASYGTPLIFPNNDPVVTAVAQEVAREGYTKAGHPDQYNPDNIFFVTDSQFGYAAAVDGIMVRERPATNLFFGTFEAESLILAETGNSIGAVQIAGTDSSIQMAFFIVACDYVLIGEELFAASGYLSGDPQVVGTLKGSDYLKVVVIVLMLLGTLLAVFNQSWFVNLFVTG
ncbi:MAG: DUF6754 domain-containing protein [candidate division Zixibacteria bacterium]